MKSISSFISSILIVGIVVSVGIIIYSFSSGTLRNLISIEEERREEVIACMGTYFDVYSYNLGNYRRKILINNSENSNDLNDYQILITLDTASLISANKMRNDCGDIRITDSDKRTLLNYWIEPNTCNSQNTKIWVKVPNIPANSNKTIYLYYGNSNLNSLSSVKNTFIREIDGLVLYLPFDEGSGTIAYDYSGNNNHGTIYNGTQVCAGNSTHNTTCPQWVDGVFRKALSFDGIDDYVDAGNAPSLNINDAMTVLAFVNFNFLDYSDGSGKLLGIANKGNPDTMAPNYGWWFAYDNRNNKKEFLYTCFGNSLGGYAGGGNNFGGSVYYYIFSISTWYHLAFTINQKEARLFINGIQHGPTKSISNLQLADTNRNLTIGKLSGMAHFYNGTIDEVRIYNRTLTAEEISDLYNNYGYSTLNYPGRTLVRKYSYPEPKIVIDNEENSTVFLYFHYSGAPTGSLGKSFIYFSNLKNGSSIQNNFEIDCNLGKDCMLSIRELNLEINDIDKIRVCSKYCLDVCNDVIFK